MAEPDNHADDLGDEEGNPREKPMGFLEHLEELRWTLVKSLGAFLAAFIVIAIFLKDAKQVLNWPLYQGLGPERAATFQMVTTSPMAVFSTIIMMCFLGAAAISLPFVLYFVGQFVAPALTKREVKLVLPTCVAAVLLFLMGAAFTYFFLVPKVVEISMEYNQWLGTQFLWEADKYYSMLTWMVLGMGAAFQFPLIILIAVHLDLVTVPTLRSWRRIVIIACFVVAAIITPTQDFLTMTIVALPLWFLYEIALIVAAIFAKRRAAREALEATTK